MRWKTWRKSKSLSEGSSVVSNYYDHPVDDPYTLVRKMVGHSILVRKSEQSLNPESIFIVFLLVGMVYWYLWRVNVRIERGQERQQAIATRIASGSNPYDAIGQLQVTALPSETPVPVIMVMPEPTLTPLPTATVAPKSELVFLKLSFYDPNIGSVIPEIADINCALFDHVNRVCISTMANGVPFGQYYGRAVACPPPMQHGDILDVIYPVQLAGQWTCMDRGWAIEYPYVDFLLRYPDMVWTGYNLNNFPWSTTVQARWIHP